MANTDVLVITGGAGGMGLACACKLADRGHLLLVDVDDAQLAEARSMLSAQGASVDTLRCDVTSQPRSPLSLIEYEPRDVFAVSCTP